MHDANLGSKNGFLLKEQRGLTIFELLGVLIILGIISTIIIPTVVGVVDKSEQDADTKTIENVGRIFAIWANQRDANGDCMLDLASDGTSNMKHVGSEVTGWSGSGDCAWRSDTMPSLDNGGFNPAPSKNFKGWETGNWMMVIDPDLMVKLGLLNQKPIPLARNGQYGLVMLKYRKYTPNSDLGYWQLHHIVQL